MRWRWEAGSPSVNQVSSDLALGPRTGGIVFKDYHTYYDFYVFGGMVHDPASNTDILVNDLWHVTAYPTYKLLQPGDTGHGKKKRSATSGPYPSPRMLGAGCGVPGVMFMVYGGYGEKDKVLGDTWIFDHRVNKWSSLEEMHPETTGNDTKVLTPPPRADMCVWCLYDKLIIFGGVGKNKNILHDMWEFDMRHLTWRELESSRKIRELHYSEYMSVYPRARNGGTTWAKGNVLYLFGGNTVSNYERERHRNSGFVRDLFMYSIESDTWSSISGWEGKNKFGNFAYQDQHTRDNHPGSRRGAVGVVDTYGNLWLFGGEGADMDPSSISSVKPPKSLADLWHFDVKAKQWAFMGGFSNGNAAGIYQGDKQTYYTGSMPGSRYDSMSVIAGNTIIVYGGTGRDASGKEGFLCDMWTVDMHNYVVYYNVPNPGTLFNLLFWPIVLLCVITVLYMCSRKVYSTSGLSSGSNNKLNTKYTPLAQETEH